MVRNLEHSLTELQASSAEREARRRAEAERRASLEKLRDYQLIDCDQHYYEPDDCFSRHLESKYQADGIEVRRDAPDGLGRIYRAGKRFRHLSGPLGERTGLPGFLREYFKTDGVVGRADSGQIRASDYPEMMVDKKARIGVLDSHEVEAALLLPTLGVVVESECCDTGESSPEVWYALMRSFNRWVEEDWGYGDGRIYGAPLVSLYDPQMAVEELDRVIAAGAKVVILRAGPAYGRSPADPIFDPFWARIQEADLVVAFHLGEFGYQDLFATQWGYGKDHSPVGAGGAFEKLTCSGDRAMSDTIVALIFGNLFGRFPNLRMMLIELGSDWIPPLLKRMDSAARRSGAAKHGLTEAPSEIFKRHFWVAPYYEDPWPEVIDCLGPEHLLLGSDWPHPEGLPEPLDMLEELPELSATDLRLIMRDNTANLLGINK